MNKILIVDAYDASRIMAGLLMRAGHEPVNSESIEIGKFEVAKLPPGAVIVTQCVCLTELQESSSLSQMAKN